MATDIRATAMLQTAQRRLPFHSLLNRFPHLRQKRVLASDFVGAGAVSNIGLVGIDLGFLRQLFLHP